MSQPGEECLKKEVNQRQIVAKSRFRFKIEKFSSYNDNEEIKTSNIEIPEFGATW
jgi:hypothetical protein